MGALQDMSREAHERKGSTMEAQLTGTITEDMEGEQLSEIIVDHWHMGAGSTVFASEVFLACKATGLPADTIMDVIGAINEHRGHDTATDVLSHAFVPKENEQAVRDLLDQIQGLCVSM